MSMGFILYMEWKCTMEPYEIEFFEKQDGTEPAKEFLLGLDVKMRAKMLRTIDLLVTNGVDLRMPYSEALGDGIFELRAKAGSDITRVLYFFYVGRKAILTNGFVKKTQRTPAKEIALAKKYRKEYLQRREQK